jgi:8-oxo-dGTP pyrophosphatase MutT (NUDIX family)
MDEGYVNGHWGSRGSGVLFVGPGRRILLLRRSQDIHKPGLWGLPGGAVPVDRRGRYQEDWTSAKREVLEEAGYRVREKPLLVLRNVQDDGFVFTTFVVLVDKAFPTQLSWEHDDSAWVTRQEAEELPLHPGIEGLLLLPKMSTLEAAREVL